MNLFRPFVEIVEFVVNTVKQGFTVKDFLIGLLGYLPRFIASVESIVDMAGNGVDSAERKRLIDDALVQFDNLTGQEGVRLIKDVKPEVEEVALDHLKEFCRTILYARFNIVSGNDNGGVDTP